MKLFNGFTEEQLHNMKEVAKTICRLGAIGVITVITCDSVKDELLRKTRYIGNVDYGDAVDAIMNSDMMSSYKQAAVMALAKDRDSGFYKAIINVVESDMMSSYKVETIENLCKKD